VAGLGFESVVALRPSLIDGERAESRPVERAGLAVARLLGPLLGKYRATPVEAISVTMVELAKRPAPGVRVVEGGTIRARTGDPA
jgi:hypothetical protein